MSSLDHLAATGLSDHVSEGETGQMFAHVASHVGPDPQEDALSFVVTSPVAVWFAKVTRHDGAINGGHDFGEGNRFGATSQDVATPDTSLGAYETDALQTEQDLLEVGLWQARSLR